MPVTFLISHSVWLCEQINYRWGEENFQHSSKKEVKVGQEGEPPPRLFLVLQAAKDSDCVWEPRVFPAAGSGDTVLWGDSWRAVTWNWLYCPFPCHCWEWAPRRWSRVGGPGFPWMDDHRLPEHLSQQEILSLPAVLLGTGLQHMVLLGQALQFHHSPWFWWLFHYHCF